MNQEDFLRKAREVHGDRYDYSKTVYKKAVEKVCIICPDHGEFWQTPHNHITNKAGCPKCCKNHNRYTTETFIQTANKIHKNKYDYSKVEYVNGQTKVTIICPEHGEFQQTPNKHLSGQGCPLCGKRNGGEKNKMGQLKFIEEAKRVHSNKYIYDEVVYINANKKVKIICPKHGEFWQTPHHHLNCHGCPICSASNLEVEIKSFLEENHIEYIYQYRSKWLDRQSLDFFLPKYKVAIECQGEQHFQKVYYRSKKWTEEKAEENYKEIQRRDDEKRTKCHENGVKLYYFAKNSFESKHKIFTDKQILLNNILGANEVG